MAQAVCRLGRPQLSTPRRLVLPNNRRLRPLSHHTVPDSFRHHSTNSYCKKQGFGIGTVQRLDERDGQFTVASDCAPENGAAENKGA